MPVPVGSAHTGFSPASNKTRFGQLDDYRSPFASVVPRLKHLQALLQVIQKSGEHWAVSSASPKSSFALVSVISLALH